MFLEMEERMELLRHLQELQADFQELTEEELEECRECIKTIVDYWKNEEKKECFKKALEDDKHCDDLIKLVRKQHNLS